MPTQRRLVRDGSSFVDGLRPALLCLRSLLRSPWSLPATAASCGDPRPQPRPWPWGVGGRGQQILSRVPGVRQPGASRDGAVAVRSHHEVAQGQRDEAARRRFASGSWSSPFNGIAGPSFLPVSAGWPNSAVACLMSRTPGWPFALRHGRLVPPEGGLGGSSGASLPGKPDFGGAEPGIGAVFPWKCAENPWRNLTIPWNNNPIPWKDNTIPWIKRAIPWNGTMFPWKDGAVPWKHGFILLFGRAGYALLGSAQVLIEERVNVLRRRAPSKRCPPVVAGPGRRFARLGEPFGPRGLPRDPANPCNPLAKSPSPVLPTEVAGGASLLRPFPLAPWFSFAEGPRLFRRTQPDRGLETAVPE